jgi:hypothetical protein
LGLIALSRAVNGPAPIVGRFIFSLNQPRRRCQAVTTASSKGIDHATFAPSQPRYSLHAAMIPSFQASRFHPEQTITGIGGGVAPPGHNPLDNGWRSGDSVQ